MRKEAETFERLFKLYYAEMYKTAFVILHDEEESKDAVSDVFTKLWDSSRRHYDDITAGYLITSVRNRCLNVIAHKHVNDRLRELYPLEISLSMSPDDEHERRLDEISSFIETDLSPQTRRVLQLCFTENKSYSEAANILDVSTSAINKHIVQALKKLRSKFD